MIRVRENKFPLVLGWVLAVVGAAIGLAFAVKGGDGLVGVLLLEVPVLLAAVGCLMDYYLRSLMIVGSECCYRTMFGRSRFFMVNNIKEVRLHRGWRYDAYISLVDEQGRVLVRLEKNMAGAEELLSYLGKRNVPISVSDESPFNIPECYEDTAKDGKQFYQTPAWKKRIRILRNLLSVVGILLYFVTWLILPPTRSAWIYIGYPLALYVFYLVFHGAITVGSPKNASEDWKQTHITLPCIGLLLLLADMGASEAFFNFRDFNPFTWFPFVAVPLVVLYFLVVRPKSKVVAIWAMLLIAAYSVNVPTYINVALTTGSPSHEVAVVTHKDDYRSGKYSRVYRVDVYPQEKTFKIDGGLYANLEEGDVVHICNRTSVFGVEYCMVHQ